MTSNLIIMSISTVNFFDIPSDIILDIYIKIISYYDKYVPITNMITELMKLCKYSRNLIISDKSYRFWSAIFTALKYESIPNLIGLNAWNFIRCIPDFKLVEIKDTDRLMVWGDKLLTHGDYCIIINDSKTLKPITKLYGNINDICSSNDLLIKKQVDGIDIYYIDEFNRLK